MGAIVKDVLKANVVLVGIDLLEDASKLTAFAQAVGSEVVNDSRVVISPSQEKFPRSLNIPRDRILIESIGERSIVTREYPKEEDLKWLSQVVMHAMNYTSLEGQEPRAFGFNIELVFEQDSGKTAQQYIGQSIFSKTFLVGNELKLDGGAGRLIFQDGERTWTLGVEPRFNDPEAKSVYMTLNNHVEEAKLPEEEEIRRFLNAIWKRAFAFVAEIDRNVDS